MLLLGCALMAAVGAGLLLISGPTYLVLSLLFSGVSPLILAGVAVALTGLAMLFAVVVAWPLLRLLWSLRPVMSLTLMVIRLDCGEQGQRPRGGQAVIRSTTDAAKRRPRSC